MGKSARLGVFCLMALAIAVSRLIEVELKPPPLEVRAAAPASGSSAAEESAAQAEAEAEAPAPAPAPAAPAERRYVVRGGDTLGSISKKAYGTTRHWRAILDANRDVIPDPKRMRDGVELRLPEVSGQ